MEIARSQNALNNSAKIGISTAQDTNPEKPWFVKSKARLLFTLFLVFTLPALVLTFLVTRYVRDQIESQAVQQNLAIARIVSHSVEEKFYSMRQQVEDFSYRSKIIEFSVARNERGLQEKLHEFVRISPHFSRAIVLDTNGIMLADYPPTPALRGKNLSQRSWFIGAKDQDHGYISDINLRTVVDHSRAVTVCGRILDENKKNVGFLAGQFTTEQLATWTAGIKGAASGGIVIVDRKGAAVFEKYATNGVAAKLRHLSATLTENEGWLFDSTTFGNEKRLVSFTRVPDVGWTILAHQPASQIFAPVKTLFRTILIFLALCLLVAALVGFYWFNTVSKFETQREAGQQELQNYAIQLRRSNQELEAMCYSIAHDLRAPLRSMRGFALALKEDYEQSLDECGQDFVKRISDSAQRMDDLTQDLLDYGRLSHVEFDVHPVDLNLTINKVLITFSEELDASQSCVEITKPLPMVAGNEAILEQIFGHLVSNALKFRKPDAAPRLKIWTEDQGEKVQIKIRDNGIGIDPAHHKKIFGVFERLHHYSDIPGTGIGLAIVKRGAERLRGRIGLESKQGDGTCFWIELPKIKNGD